MANNTHGGARKNAGRKPLSEDEKLNGISLTVQVKGAKLKKHGKEYIKERVKVAAQKEADRIK